MVHAMEGTKLWVTGAGSGIGEALVRRLVEQGADVWVSGRREEPLQALAEQLGDQVHVLPCDVADDDAMATLFQQSDAAPEYLDGILLCAGIVEYIDLPPLDVASIRRVTEVNFLGVVNACSAALPLLQAAASRGRRPWIAGLSSMSTYVGFHRAEAYGSAKAAMAYFLDSLRCDVGEQMDVCVVYPGFVKTPMTDNNDFSMPTMVSVDYAADCIIKGIEKRRRRIYFPRRLHALLSLARGLPGLWYGRVIPRLKGRDRNH